MIIAMRRFLWLLLPLSFVVTVALAAWLQANAAGLGTHRTLGLPPCLFLTLTGLPCPSCGLTTSFTHLVHFQVLAAFRAHPLGPALFSLFAFLSLCSLLEFFKKDTPLRDFLNGRHVRWVYGSVAVFLITWGSRLLWRF